MTKTEIFRVQQYMREKFGTPNLILSQKPRNDGSVEVSIGDEFIGVIYRDDEEGEVSYDFNMAILDIDLPVAVGVPKG